MIWVTLFFTTIIVYFTNIYLTKNNLLLSQSGEKHQKFVEKKNITKSGGIYLGFFLSVIFFLSNYKIFSIFILIFLFLGLLVDIKIIKKQSIRILLQSFIVFLIIYFYDLQILSTRITLLDFFLKYKLLNYIFVCFCILILVNGTNFIDGLNGLAIGYYLIILFFLYNNNFLIKLSLQHFEIIVFFYILFLLYILNILNKLYLGDSGSYLLSLIFSFIILDYYRLEHSISPYHVILLLWYPCFENLFSILRKLRFNKSPIQPDNDHFHQLFFFFLKKKKYSNLFANNLSSLCINIFNFLLIYIGSTDIFSTKLQISLIFFNVSVYLILYFLFYNFKYKNSKT